MKSIRVLLVSGVLLGAFTVQILCFGIEHDAHVMLRSVLRRLGSPYDESNLLSPRVTKHLEDIARGRICCSDKRRALVHVALGLFYAMHDHSGRTDARKHFKAAQKAGQLPRDIEKYIADCIDQFDREEAYFKTFRARERRQHALAGKVEQPVYAVAESSAEPASNLTMEASPACSVTNDNCSHESASSPSPRKSGRPAHAHSVRSGEQERRADIGYDDAVARVMYYLQLQGDLEDHDTGGTLDRIVQSHSEYKHRRALAYVALGLVKGRSVPAVGVSLFDDALKLQSLPKEIEGYVRRLIQNFREHYAPRPSDYYTVDTDTGADSDVDAMDLS